MFTQNCRHLEVTSIIPKSLFSLTDSRLELELELGLEFELGVELELSVSYVTTIKSLLRWSLAKGSE